MQKNFLILILILNKFISRYFKFVSNLVKYINAGQIVEINIFEYNLPLHRQYFLTLNRFQSVLEINGSFFAKIGCFRLDVRL